jgi:hypothetical protein
MSEQKNLNNNQHSETPSASNQDLMNQLVSFGDKKSD